MNDMSKYTDDVKRRTRMFFKWSRKLYIAAYNVYGWYWLYKIVFVLDFNWENYVIWTLAMFGQYYFAVDNQKKLGLPDIYKETD